VEILYDSMGVPHVWAESVEDALFAQGFLHARHRLWQMEMFRRVAQGRLSELFGSPTVDTDRFLRTLDLHGAAEKGLPRHSPDFVHLLDRYVAGVNAALESWSGPMPPELLLLRHRPDPWTAALALSMEKIMAWDLAEYGTGLSLAAARELVGDEEVQRLLPSYPSWGVSIVGGWPLADDETPGPFEASPVGTTDAIGVSVAASGALPPAPARGLPAQAALPQEAEWALELGSTVRASNSWVVGPDRSESGAPLLANDMHLGLNAPTLWFLVGLHAPGLNVVGMSLPGAPGVVAGHSDAVAWGFTNAGVDDSDFFVERLDPGDSARYLTPWGSEAFQVRDEVIRVRGEPDVVHRVRSTRHGPVMAQVEPRAGGELLAFQWVAHEVSGTPEALVSMNRARSAEEFLQALRGFQNPHQNVVFADTAGAWGYWMAGSVPLRRRGGPSLLPVPGWTGDHDWTGWLAFENHPHTLAPARGYVATANNAQGHDSVAALVTAGAWARPYRAQRISELLEARELHTAETLLDIQMDVGSAFVDRYRAQAVEAFHRVGLPDQAEELDRWDGRADLGSEAATLFHAWVQAVRVELRSSFYGGAEGYFPTYMVERALEGAFPLAPTVLTDAARRAADAASGRPWGEAHTLSLGHPMADLPVVGRLFEFGRRGIPLEGGPHSVNVAPLSGGGPPWQVTFGPSQRHVVDLGDLDGAGGFILPGGQSGWPDGTHSFDQLDRWLRGDLWLLPMSRARVEERTVSTLVLEPSPEG
jgi:penicillin amidase